MSAFAFDIPAELVEAVAVRAAELVRDQAQAGDRWLTVDEAAEHLRCPKSRIYALTSTGRIPHHRDGSRLLFRQSELDRWVEQGGAKRP